MKTRAANGAVIAALLAAGMACSLGQGDVPRENATPATAVTSGVSSPYCENPLMPVSPGQLRFYTVTGDPKGDYTYSTSIGRLTAAGFETDAVLAGVTRTISWECTPAGLAVLTPGGGTTATLATDNTFADFETTGHSGVTLPAIVAAGDQWVQVLQVSGRQVLPDGSQGDSSGTYTISFTATDMENLTVPGGTFNARRIEWVLDMNFTVTVLGVATPVHLGYSGIDWYAPGVGLVQQIVESDHEYIARLESPPGP